MKIERDKWYLTWEGKKVFVVYDEAGDDQPIVGVWEDGAVGKFCRNGRYYNGDKKSLNDLVSEYVEPRKPMEFWAVIGTRANGSSEIICDYLSKDAAESQAAIENSDPWERSIYRVALLREVIE